MPLIVVIAACYLLAGLGALPSHETVLAWFGERNGERFICESDACGCASAHECWTSCCCHSLTERLAWAIREGVAPPADVRFTDEQWLAAMNAAEPGRAHCELCVDGAKSRLARGEPTEDRLSSRSDSGSGPSLSPLGCKGVRAMMLVSVPPSLTEQVAFAPPGLRVVVAVVSVENDTALSRVLNVAAPPPRAGV